MQDNEAFLAQKSPYRDFLENPNIAGFSFNITWHTVEPSQGNYDFSQIDRLVETAANYGKKSIIRIYDRAFWDVSCDQTWHPDYPLPDYIASTNLQSGGCVAQFWQEDVRSAYIQLMTALAASYDEDTRVSAIFLEESATDLSNQQIVDETSKSQAFIDLVIKTAEQFRYTIVSAHWNYPEETVHQFMDRKDEWQHLGIGLSEPDALPHRDQTAIATYWRQYKNELPVMPNMDGSLQNCDENTPQQLYDYHKETANYLVWAKWRACDEDTYSATINNFLSAEPRPLQVDCPTAIVCATDQ